MASSCLDMQNSSRKPLSSSSSCPPMSPRISFSNDFAESTQYSNTKPGPRSEAPSPPPSSSDFEFSVTDYSMMSADELFCKGRLVPAFKKPTTTLREELLVGDDDENDDDDGFSLRPPKGSGSARWKEILGLKKAHIGSKKPAKAGGSSVDQRRPALVMDLEPQVVKTSQEVFSDGRSSSCRNVEFGM